jgi:hypothetical protein
LLVVDDAGGNEDTELWWVVSGGGKILLVFVIAQDCWLMVFGIADFRSEPGTVKAWLTTGWDGVLELGTKHEERQFVIPAKFIM